MEDEEKEPLILKDDETEPSNNIYHDQSTSSGGGSPDNNNCWSKCKCTRKTVCIWIAVTIVAAVLLFVGTALLAAYLYTRKVNASPANGMGVIGGGVPMIMGLPDEFDSCEVDKVHLNLSNITGINGITTVYYGKCDDIQTSSRTLHDRAFIVNNSLLKPQKANYFPDSPIYALNGSSLSYHIKTSTNSSKQGCAYIVLFNTSKSYQMFFDGQRNDYKFYNKSGCIKIVKRGQLATSHTLKLNESTFIFGAITSNVTYIANVTISGNIREYNTSSLAYKTVNTTLSDNVLSIDLCESLLCDLGLCGEKKCILVKTSGNNTIIKYSDEKVDLPLNELKKHKITVRYACTTAAVGAALIALVIVIYMVLKYRLAVKKLKANQESQGKSHDEQETNTGLKNGSSSYRKPEVEEGNNDTSEMPYYDVSSRQ